MGNNILNFFDHKICRTCGQIFYGENDICDDCLVSFSKLEIQLKSSKYAEYLKYCKYCGRPFIGGYEAKRGEGTYFQPTRSVYCKGIDGKGNHYCQCQNCGGSAKATTSGGNWPVKIGCSRKCSNIIKRKKTVETCLEKYGTEAPAQSAQIQEKMRRTTFERYGVESYLQKGHTRDIADAKMRAKYGVESNISQNPEIRKKITDTVTKNHGGYTWASEELAERCKQTSLEKYGTEYPTQSDEIKQKTRNTVQQKYGVDNVFQSDEIKHRIQETCLVRYGVNWVSQSPEVIENRRKRIIQNYANTITDPLKRQNYLDFMADPVAYVKNHFEDKPTLYDVKNSIGGLDDSTIYFHLGEGNSSELLSRVYSIMEKDIRDFIHSLDLGITISQNNRKIISPKEIDLYLPDYKIGIECNPTATHNSSLPFKDLDIDVISIKYHQNKTNLCEEKGIFLLHIFGYEWSWKRDIIKSMIRHILGKCENKYYARQLHVEEISFYECKSFLNMNHRQGFTNAKVRLGLKTEDGTLVSVMTFDKTRHTIGSKNSDTEYTWELSRFCNLLNTSVVGGASKLFKYFIRNYQYDKIISFSDRAHTRGNLYEILGFHKVSISEPNYAWVNYGDDTFYNRVSCQKRNLPKLLNEPDLDIENQTEKQIMMSHGYVQVFDSGTIRWEYISN